MIHDFNDVGPQRSFDVIPDGTVATLAMKIRPGGAGEGGYLRRSKAGDSEAIDGEFIVCDGSYSGRRFWTLLTVAGTTEGHAQAADISRRRLRAILESARGIKPDDDSPAAREARRTTDWGDFNGLKFIGRIGVEPARGEYKAKNVLAEVITPERREWHPVEQDARPATAAVTAAAVTAPAVAPAPSTLVRPSWAN